MVIRSMMRAFLLVTVILLCAFNVASAESWIPTGALTNTPSTTHSALRSSNPSIRPSPLPTATQSAAPTKVQTGVPTKAVLLNETSALPEMGPTYIPSESSSTNPMSASSSEPSLIPTSNSSIQPFAYPTTTPSVQTNNVPSASQLLDIDAFVRLALPALMDEEAIAAFQGVTLGFLSRNVNAPADVAVTLLTVSVVAQYRIPNDTSKRFDDEETSSIIVRFAVRGTVVPYNSLSNSSFADAVLYGIRESFPTYEQALSEAMPIFEPLVATPHTPVPPLSTPTISPSKGVSLGSTSSQSPGSNQSLSGLYIALFAVVGAALVALVALMLQRYRAVSLDSSAAASNLNDQDEQGLGGVDAHLNGSHDQARDREFEVKEQAPRQSQTDTAIGEKTQQADDSTPGEGEKAPTTSFNNEASLGSIVTDLASSFAVQSLNNRGRRLSDLEPEYSSSSSDSSDQWQADFMGGFLTNAGGSAGSASLAGRSCGSSCEADASGPTLEENEGSQGQDHWIQVDHDVEPTVYEELDAALKAGGDMEYSFAPAIPNLPTFVPPRSSNLSNCSVNAPVREQEIGPQSLSERLKDQTTNFISSVRALHSNEGHSSQHQPRRNFIFSMASAMTACTQPNDASDCHEMR